ncbi:MAG TPA: hypothetical protein PK926_08625 [Spirochaetota bacterium]|nr:hypothetical protein [Spirochaetota bacterium]HPI90107.1 hypothetical protein [Spirochaetota bacterium]HPR49547.1 hypothetical protein [Spirochaetota bacterium]
MKVPGKKKIVILLLTIAGMAVLLLYVALKKSAPDIFWDREAGQMYRITFSDITAFRVKKGRKIPRTFRLTGVLNFRILETGETIKTAVQISPVKVAYNGTEYPRLKEIYSSLFLVDFNPGGTIESLHFDNTIAQDDEREVASIIRQLQFVIRKSITSSWNTTEEDSTGRYKARYSFEDNRLTKRKADYVEVLDEWGFPRKGITAKVRESLLEVNYGRPDSWITGASGKEKVSLFSEEESFATSNTSVILTKIEFEPDKNLEIWKTSRDSADIIETWKSIPKNSISFADSLEIDAIKKKHGGVSLTNMAGNLFAQYAEFDYNAVNELMTLLKLYPEQAEIVPDLLLKKNFNKMQKTMLVHALERAQHAEAQKALCRVMTDENFEDFSRIQAAMALGAIEKPEEKTVEQLWQAYFGRENGDELAMRVSNSAVLSLGALSNKLSASNNEEDHDKAETVRDAILRELENSGDVTTTTALLAAAGNTGDTEVLDAIEDRVESAQPIVRSAAASSLRNIEGDEADTILMNSLKKEAVSTVRESIVKTVAARKSNENVTREMMSLLPRENDENVRELMYRYMLKNRDQRGVKEKLREMLKSEDSLKNRLLINKALHATGGR